MDPVRNRGTGWPSQSIAVGEIIAVIRAELMGGTGQDIMMRTDRRISADVAGRTGDTSCISMD